MFRPGNCFTHNGSDWICRICGDIANNKHGVSVTLRKNARYYYTIEGCASGPRIKSREVHAQATAKAKLQEPRCHEKVMTILYGSRIVWEIGEGSIFVNAPRVKTRSRSRSLPQPAKENPETNHYLGKRLAKKFNGKFYFDNDVKRIRGLVLAAKTDGKNVWQAVWKVMYDDADTEDLTRFEFEPDECS